MVFEDVWAVFDGRPHALRMGLQPLAPDRWAVVEPDLGAELDRKASLLATRSADVLATTAHPAAAELRDLLIAHLTTDHRRYGRDGRTLVLLDDGRRWDIDDFDPLDLAGRIVSEDWCLVRPGAPPTLAAATLCSPNRWRLREKLGRPVTDIHDPVPGYRERLGAPVDAVLRGARRVWRRNWSMQSSPARFQPYPEGPERPVVPDEVWIRSEYETLVRLPSSGWWVFGIQTTVVPLALAGESPDLAARILLAVQSLDPGMAAYKDLAGWRGDLVEWLGRQSRSMSAKLPE